MESLVLFAIVWLVHAVVAGLPVIVMILAGKRRRWGFSAALLILPFLALIPAQGMWAVGGMVSYLIRLLILTGVVLVAQLVEVLPFMRRAPTFCHVLLLAAAVLAVVPIQLMVPAYPD